MKKTMFLAAALFFLVTAVCFSQDSSAANKTMTEKGAMAAGMIGQGMKDKMAGRHTKMYMPGMMMNKSMVATSDGGVIVMAGNKLLKYDKDLNLQKEVELKIDPLPTGAIMDEMMKECPAIKKKMLEEGREGAEAEEADRD
jgi:hypothetical protein